MLDIEKWPTKSVAPISTPSFKNTDVSLDLNVYEICQASLAYLQSFYLLFKTLKYV